MSGSDKPEAHVPAGQVSVLLLDGQARLLTWDGVAQALLGYSADDVLGRKAHQIFPEIDSGEELWARGLAGGRVDLRGVTQDGREVPLEAQLSAIERGPERMVAAILWPQRVSRVEGERGLLYERLAAVGELAAGMAHDYNNILGTIILYTEMLQASSHLDGRDRARVEVVLEQAKRGAQLTNQVLDFTRRSDVERRPMDFKALLTETWSLLEAILPTGITVEATMDGERFVVNGDPGRLQQALMNLAINARDAMSDGGRLEFRLATFDLRPEEPSPYRDMSPGEWIRLEVTDTGVGIAPDVLPRIFEPFFTTKGDGKGTGLGLAQVYGIVKRHDGYVEVRSHLGAGTTFTMYLPADDRQPHRGPDVLVTDTGNHEGATVLVIEDDEGTRPALSQVLEIKGYSVLSAATGTQASDILERHEGNVDIVLCDVHLPDADGQDLSLRLGRRWKRPRFVLMSGYSLGLATREAVSDARYRWLSKPFTIAELTAALRAPSN